MNRADPERFADYLLHVLDLDLRRVARRSRL